VSAVRSFVPAGVPRWGCLLVAGLAVLTAGCSSGSGDGVVSDQNSVTLLEVQAQVFSPRCALSGCHVGAGAPLGLDLSSGASAGNLVGVPSAEIPGLLRVESGNAADSYLYMKLVDDPAFSATRCPCPADRSVPAN
jgi:hypothetical protein